MSMPLPRRAPEPAGERRAAWPMQRPCPSPHALLPHALLPHALLPHALLPHGFFRLAGAAALVAFALSACRQEPQPADGGEAAAPTAPHAIEAPAAGTAAGATADIDPDGPDWARSLPWQAGAPCRAQAQMLYEQIGARLRGRSLEDQMQAYAERDELGPGKAAMLPQIRAQLERLYAAEPAQLEQLPSAVAAECLALQPPVDVSAERALDCHLRHAHPVFRNYYTSTTPPSTDQVGTADHQLHRCLRGKI